MSQSRQMSMLTAFLQLMQYAHTSVKRRKLKLKAEFEMINLIAASRAETTGAFDKSSDPVNLHRPASRPVRLRRSSRSMTSCTARLPGRSLLFPYTQGQISTV